jgi:hypothetical protein
LRLHELVLEMIKTLKVKRNCTAKKNDTCHYNEDSGPGELNAIGPNLRVFWLAKSSTAPFDNRRQGGKLRWTDAKPFSRVAQWPATKASARRIELAWS